MSTCLLYSFPENISGALYSNDPAYVLAFSFENKGFASPKSVITHRSSLKIRIFSGLISL